jgi:hypothetical protein
MQTLADFAGQSQGPVQRRAMPAPTQRQFLTGASTRDPFLAKPAHLGPEVSGDRSLPSYTTLSRAMVQLGRGRRAGSRTACRDGGRGRRMPVRERVRSMARYAAGCSGAAGDTSCELRPWSTSESRSNSLGQTIVRSSGSTRTWRKTAGSQSGSLIGPAYRWRGRRFVCCRHQRSGGVCRRQGTRRWLRRPCDGC